MRLLPAWADAEIVQIGHWKVRMGSPAANLAAQCEAFAREEQKQWDAECAAGITGGSGASSGTYSHVQSMSREIPNTPGFVGDI